MKRLLMVLCAVVALTANAQKSKEPFPQEIIDLVATRNFGVVVDKIIGIPPWIANAETPPRQIVSVTPDKLAVSLAYYDFDERGPSDYSFSDFGRMLTFESKEYDFKIRGLNRPGDLYSVKIDLNAFQITFFRVNLELGIYADGAVLVTVHWQNFTQQYLGQLAQFEQ